MNILCRTERDKFRASNRELVEATGVSGKTITKILAEFKTSKIIADNGVRYMRINPIQLYRQVRMVPVTDVAAAIAAGDDFSKEMASDRHRNRHEQERVAFRKQQRAFFASQRQQQEKAKAV